MTLQELVVKIRADTAEFDKKVQSMRKNLDKAARGMLIAGGAIATGLSFSVKKAINFESEMANVSTMLDENSMRYMPEFEKGIEELSKKFGEGTKTLSEGLYNILSASVPPAKAMKVLEVSVKSAAAGLTDTGVAADAITTILNSYGMSADKAGEVSDKLFAIVKRGKTTFGELAPAIGRVASTASKAGLSFDELGAAIATLTRSGISTDEAMTALSGVLQTFLKPSKDAAEVAKQFGFELNTATLKTLGLSGVMEKLKNASAEQLAVLFPNIRGLKGIAAALGDASGYAKDYNLMLKSAGLTEEAFKKQSNTTEFQIKQLKEQFNALAVGIGTSLLPVVKQFIGALQPLIDRFNNLPKPVKENIAKFAALAAAVLLVGGGIAKLISMILNTAETIKKAMKGISLLVSTNPMLLVITGIIAAVILLYEAWKHNWGGIREKTAVVWKRIKPVFDTLVQVIGTVIEFVKKLWDKWEEAWPHIKDTLQRIWDKHLAPIFKSIQNAINSTIEVIKDIIDWFDRLFDKINNATKRLSKFVGEHAKGTGEVVTGGMGDLVGGTTLPGFASGGFVSRPTLAVLGEKEPEYIIPASQMNNRNTEKLLRQVLAELRKLNNQTMPESTRNIAFSVSGLGGKV